MHADLINHQQTQDRDRADREKAQERLPAGRETGELAAIASAALLLTHTSTTIAATAVITASSFALRAGTLAWRASQQLQQPED